MIPRYSRPEMAQIFSDEARMLNWLRVEQAVLTALSERGIVPEKAAAALRTLLSVDVTKVQEREAEIHHDLAAFVDVVAEAVPEAAGWIHYGLTSSDVVDTALALQITAAARLIDAELKRLISTVIGVAYEHKNTPMLGRTHGMPAETITFGAKLAGWAQQLHRCYRALSDSFEGARVGKLSGAVGLYSGISSDIEKAALQKLELRRDASATQIVQRDVHASVLMNIALVASVLDRIATEIRHLQRADVAEAAEPFAVKQKGSSAMPHKRNPIVSERISGLARVLRSHTEVALNNVVLWHERDISHSSAERIIIPDAFILLDYLLSKTIWLIDGLQVNQERMRLNIDSQRGLVASQRVLLALIETGMDRDEAYRITQEAATSVYNGDKEKLIDALIQSEAVTKALTDTQLNSLCDSSYIPPGVEDIFAELSEITKAL